jgi:hypothetical protein
MNPTARTARQPRRELAQRESDGIVVSLLWHPDDNQLAVLVVDEREHSSLEVPVGANKPLDVFNHPYAYAAAQERGRAVVARPLSWQG